MSKKVSLYVLGLSYSQLQSGAYAVILAEANGPRRIPVVIGAPEAQSIAVALEGIRTPRPLTHDLFVSFAQAFGVKLEQVFIYRFEDGIFSSELTFSDGKRTITIDARTSDAIAVAMRAHAPIFTTAEIIEETGFVISDNAFSRPGELDGDDLEEDADDTEDALTVEQEPRYDPYEGYNRDPDPEKYSVEQLEITLSELIEREEYEEAAKISEILERKRRLRNGMDDNAGV